MVSIIKNHETKESTAKGKFEKYRNALIRLISSQEYLAINEASEKDSVLKYVNLGVRMIYHIKTEDARITEEAADALFDIENNVLGCIGLLTPRHIMQLFPITKHYDGDKYEAKDYYYTIKKVIEHGMDTPIGDVDATFDFLWDYDNMTLRIFLVNYMSAVSWKRQFMGGQDPFVEFMHSEGVATYTMYEKDEYMVNNLTGECTKIKKPKKRIPKQFKVVRE